MTENTNTAWCPNCGTPLAAGARFCAACGRPVDVLPAPPSQPVPPAAAPDTSAPEPQAYAQAPQYAPPQGYGAQPGYGQPQGYGAPQGYPGYYAPARSNRTPIVVGLLAIGLVLVLLAGGLAVLATRGSSGGSAAPASTASLVAGGSATPTTSGAEWTPGPSPIVVPTPKATLPGGTGTGSAQVTIAGTTVTVAPGACSPAGAGVAFMFGDSEKTNGDWVAGIVYRDGTAPPAIAGQVGGKLFYLGSDATGSVDADGKGTFSGTDDAGGNGKITGTFSCS